LPGFFSTAIFQLFQFVLPDNLLQICNSSAHIACQHHTLCLHLIDCVVQIDSVLLRRAAKLKAAYQAALKPRLLVPVGLALLIAIYNAVSGEYHSKVTPLSSHQKKNAKERMSRPP
jgi:hypothetical protein